MKDQSAKELGLQTYTSKYEGKCTFCRKKYHPEDKIVRLTPSLLDQTNRLGLTTKVFKYAHLGCLPLLVEEEYIPLIKGKARFLVNLTDPMWPKDNQGFSAGDASPAIKWLQEGCPRIGAYGIARRLVKYLDTQLGGKDTEENKIIANIGNGSFKGNEEDGGKVEETKVKEAQEKQAFNPIPRSTVRETRKQGEIFIEMNGDGKLRIHLDPPWENKNHLQVKDTIKKNGAWWDAEGKYWKLSPAVIAEKGSDLFCGQDVGITEKTVKTIEEAMDRRALSQAESIEQSGVNTDIEKRLKEVLPEGLELFPFQYAGVAFSEKAQGKVLISDEMGCIDGNAEVTINRGGCARRMKLKVLYKKFNGINKGKKWNKSIPTNIRSLCNGELRLNKVVSVLDKGIKPVVKVILKSGKELRLTSDHEVCVSNNNFKEVQYLKHGSTVLTNGIPICKSCGVSENVITSKYAKFVGYCKTCMYRQYRSHPKTKNGRTIRKGGIYITAGLRYHPAFQKHTGIPEHRLVYEASMNNMSLDQWLNICKGNKFESTHVFLDTELEIHHKNNNCMDNRLENLEAVTKSDHKRRHKAHLRFSLFKPIEDFITSIKPDGFAHVYDIVCSDPYRNFVANDIIVHNCGKTIQAIAYSALHLEDRPILCVVPAIVSTNWENEFKKWLPKEKVYRVKTGKDIISTEYKVLVITYGLATRLEKTLIDFGPQIIILDESHHLKNTKTKRTKAIINIIKSCKPKSILALSGTPVINRPIEFFTTLKILKPSDFGNWLYYAKKYCNGHQTRFGWEVNGASNTKELSSRLRDLMIRRKKEDVLKELPDKVRVTSEVELTPSMRREYEKAIHQAYLDNDDGAHLAAISAGRRKVGLAKVKAAIEWIEEYHSQGLPVVVFAHHRAVLNALQESCDKKQIMCRTIAGDTSHEARGKIVEAFQKGQLDVVLISTLAGGVGITLTRASNVLFVERQWTPAAEEQAEDRLHRIGQKRSVTIRYLMVPGTVDEDMAELIEEKRSVLHSILDGAKIDSKLDIRKDLIKRWKTRMKSE